MTTEQQQLLIKDICARLPYKVKVQVNKVSEWDGETKRFTVSKELTFDDVKSFAENGAVLSIKPFLRSVSSMTEEEKWDFGRIFNSFSCLKLELLESGLSFHEIYDITGRCDITWNELNNAIDWFNAHHFDFRNLIPMGLALPATEGMYNF